MVERAMINLNNKKRSSSKKIKMYQQTWETLLDLVLKESPRLNLNLRSMDARQQIELYKFLWRYFYPQKPFNSQTFHPCSVTGVFSDADSSDLKDKFFTWWINEGRKLTK